MSNKGANKIIVVKNIGNTSGMVTNENCCCKHAWNTRMDGSKKNVERKLVYVQ
jgi:hypothetical protein